MSGPWEYQELLPREPIHVIIEPIRRFEMGLHPWVAFVIMPTFALANAGVRIEGAAVLGMAAPGCR